MASSTSSTPGAGAAPFSSSGVSSSGNSTSSRLKPIWKLQDFLGHHGAIQSARLGQKSGQLVATGGEDRRVNIWQVSGPPQPLITLSGHASTPQSLVFDQGEENLVVGCQGGSIQVWNLGTKKVQASFTGHRTSCECVEFHPYVRLWGLETHEAIDTKTFSVAIRSCWGMRNGSSSFLCAE